MLSWWTAQSNWRVLRWPPCVSGSTSLTCYWDNLSRSRRRYRSTISFGRETLSTNSGSCCHQAWLLKESSPEIQKNTYDALLIFWTWYPSEFGRLRAKAAFFSNQQSSVRYSTSQCTLHYGFVRMYSPGSGCRVDVTLPRAVRRPVRCGAASSLPRDPEAAYVAHHSNRR